MSKYRCVLRDGITYARWSQPHHRDFNRHLVRRSPHTLHLIDGIAFNPTLTLTLSLSLSRSKEEHTSREIRILFLNDGHSRVYLPIDSRPRPSQRPNPPPSPGACLRCTPAPTGRPATGLRASRRIRTRHPPPIRGDPPADSFWSLLCLFQIKLAGGRRVTPTFPINPDLAGSPHPPSGYGTQCPLTILFFCSQAVGCPRPPGPLWDRARRLWGPSQPARRHDLRLPRPAAGGSPVNPRSH